MSNLSYNYDQIVLSEDKVKYLAKNVIKCIESMTEVVSTPCEELHDSKSAAAGIMAVERYFFVTIGSCLESMADDWNKIFQAIVHKADFECYMSENIKKVEPNIVNRVNTAIALNMPGFVTEQLLNIGRMTVNSSRSAISGITVEYEYIKISNFDIDKVEDRAYAYRNLIQEIQDYSEAVQAFIDSKYFQGKFAESVKEYLRAAYIPFIQSFSDLAHAMRKLGQDYVDDYASDFHGLYRIDEEKMKSFMKNLNSICDVISQKIYSANKLVYEINACSNGEIDLNSYRYEDFSKVDHYIAVCTSDLQKVRTKEDKAMATVKTFVHDVERLHIYAGMLKKTSGFNILSANVDAFRKLNNKIETKYEMNTKEFLKDFSLCNANGVVNEARRDKLLEIIKKDPEYACVLDDINNATSDELNGMVKYFYYNNKYGFGDAELKYMDYALGLLQFDKEWLGELYRAGNGYNGYLANPKNYIFSAENRPCDIIEKAVDWAKSRANDDEDHGYRLKYDSELRWGPDYDRTSFLVSAYEQAGRMYLGDSDINTDTIVQELSKRGFVAIPIDDNFTIDQLEYGDIITRDVDHNKAGSQAEMYTSDGRTIHAAFNSSDNPRFGDQTLQTIEETDGYDLQDYLDEYKNNKFGTDYTPENYINEDGVSVVGEISGHMVASPGSNTFTYSEGEPHWQYVLRYTGGV